MAQNYICADNGTRLYPVSTASTTTTVSLDIGHTHVDGYFVRPTHHAVALSITKRFMPLMAMIPCSVVKISGK